MLDNSTDRDPKELYQERAQRIADAAAIKETDRSEQLRARDSAEILLESMAE